MSRNVEDLSTKIRIGLAGGSNLYWAYKTVKCGLKPIRVKFLKNRLEHVMIHVQEQDILPVKLAGWQGK